MIQPQDIVSNLVPARKFGRLVRTMGTSFAIAGIGLTDERVNVIKSERIAASGGGGPARPNHLAGDPVNFKLWIGPSAFKPRFNSIPFCSELQHRRRCLTR